VADLLQRAGEDGEARALHLTARNFASAAARIQAAQDLARRPQCCSTARLFGDCQCVGQA